MYAVFFYFLCGIILVFLYGYRIFARIKLRHIPGPRPSWLFGNLFSIKHLAQDVTRWAYTHGPVYKFFTGGRAMIVVSDAELGRKIYMKSHHRPLNAMTPPSGGIRRKYQEEGLFFSDQKFKSLKSAWQVALNQGSVHNYFGLMLGHADQLCDVINSYAQSGEVFNIYEDIQKMTLEVVGTTAFGIHFGSFAQNDDDDVNNQFDKQLIQYLRTLFKGSQINPSGRRPPWVILNMLFPELRSLWGSLASRFPIGQTDKASLEAILGVAAVSQKIVNQEQNKLKQVANGDDKDPSNNVKNGVHPGSFIAQIAKAKDSTTGQLLTNLQVGAQAFVFILAGFDTTANTIAFSIYLLSKNPLKKQKLWDEIDQFQDDDSLEYQTLDKCTYLEAVIKEALRLYPAGAMSGRQTNISVQLSKYTFPPKSNFLINIYGMHRDPLVWSKPEEYIPERFIEGAEEYVMDKIHPFQYLPFGAGSRMCIGHRYAMQEAKLTLFKLFKKFDFKLESGQEELITKLAITLGPKNGVHVYATNR